MTAPIDLIWGNASAIAELSFTTDREIVKCCFEVWILGLYAFGNGWGIDLKFPRAPWVLSWVSSLLMGSYEPLFHATIDMREDLDSYGYSNNILLLYSVLTGWRCRRSRDVGFAFVLLLFSFWLVYYYRDLLIILLV